MPPTGGRAAATAIRDADQLAARLSPARADAAALPAALRAYEAAMAGYAPAAIRESLGPLRWIRASSGPVATVAARAVLPVAAACRAGLGRVRRAR
jgi:2-polyprenyl-6-methoxyphenol hydroxylase-like FAD-dependent oxidoreductase